MKRVFFAIFVLSVVVFASCKDGDNAKITFYGDNNKDGELLYITDFADPQVVIDSVPFSDGKALFSGNFEQPFILFAYTVSGNSIMMIGEEGSAEYFMDKDSVAGTPLNEKLAPFSLAFHNLNVELQQASLDNGFNEDVMRLFMERYTYLSLSYFKANKDNIVGALAASLYLQQATTFQKDSYQQVMANLDGASPEVLEYPVVSVYLSQLQMQESTSKGHHYVDITGVSPNDPSSNIKLSSLIDGKVAVVDFWASWCGPCREEIIQTLIPLYKKYAAKGVVFVGISLDSTPKDCLDAVNSLGVPYQQILESSGTASQNYNIQSIPHIMLIAADGTIVARNLRGDAVEDAIIEALK